MDALNLYDWIYAIATDYGYTATSIFREGQNANRPSTKYITYDIVSRVPEFVIAPRRDREATGQNVTHDTTRSYTTTVRVNVWNDIDNAFEVLNALLDNYQLDYSIQALLAGSASIVEAGSVDDTSYLDDGKQWMDRQTRDFTINEMVTTSVTIQNDKINEIEIKGQVYDHEDNVVHSETITAP